jgi:fucose 4-O-acetylase-like acetyltransferase
MLRFQPYAHPMAKVLQKCTKEGNTAKGETPFRQLYVPYSIFVLLFCLTYDRL